MGEVIVLIQKDSEADTSWTNFFVSVASDHESALRNAIQKYLADEKGTYETFSWNDAIEKVPEHIWEDHGLRLVHDGDFLNESAAEVTVDANESLLNGTEMNN
ncbi:hypothetical protein JOC78_002137 [Bacillus ectoiniformans]|uniref:hypothetical protein n=1 Tax=Bacillus ectoiniformans TaxID=1494429 RepID=UPI001957BC54|nr:hypothetical protein [Bacillus ectoiniformans]MBM7649184.1 hypothetical protein [Bacillus ectoiniformans]